MHPSPTDTRPRTAPLPCAHPGSERPSALPVTSSPTTPSSSTSSKTSRLSPSSSPPCSPKSAGLDRRDAVQRHARDGRILLAKLRDCARTFESLARERGGTDAIFILLRYVSIITGDLQFEESHDSPKTGSPTGESLAMTRAEQFLAKGRTKGRTKGLAGRSVKDRLTVRPGPPVAAVPPPRPQSWPATPR